MNDSYRHWLGLITECRASGLSDRQWCRQNNISRNRLYYYLRKLRALACEIPASRAEENPARKQEIVSIGSYDSLSSCDYPGSDDADRKQTGEPKCFDTMCAAASHGQTTMPKCFDNETTRFIPAIKLVTPNGISLDIGTNADAAVIMDTKSIKCRMCKMEF